MANTSYIGVGPADRDPTVSDDSVTTAKIQDNAVTGAKIAMTSDAAGDVLYYNGTDYVRLAVGAAGKVLKVNSGATAPEWATDTAGTGDVVGPGSATNDALARFDTTTGKLIQNSTATLSDAGTLTATAFSGALAGNVTGNVTGNIDGIVGGTTPAAGSFTSITATLDIDLASDKNLQWSANEKITSLSASSNDIALYAGGAERIRFAVGGGIGLAGANYGTSGQVMTSAGASANPSWTTITTDTSGAWTSGTSTTGKALVMGF